MHGVNIMSVRHEGCRAFLNRQFACFARLIGRLHSPPCSTLCGVLSAAQEVNLEGICCRCLCVKQQVGCDCVCVGLNTIRGHFILLLGGDEEMKLAFGDIGDALK